MRRLLTAGVAVAAIAALTSCSQAVTDPSVGHGVQAAVYTSITAGWQNLTAEAQRACQAQMMGGDVSTPAAAFSAAAKKYEAAWASARRNHVEGPRLPEKVTVPTTAADWCGFSQSLTSGH